jgi:tetratricopeptide (TPR) repeat protein
MAARKAFAERDYEAAARLFTRALDLDPSNPDALRLGGYFATLLRREELMLEIGEATIAHDPLCAVCLRQLVDSNLQLGRLDEAERLLRPAVAADPQAFRTTRGLVRLLQGKPAEALELFEPSETPLGAYLHRSRAMALHDLGRKQEAAAELEQLEGYTELGDHALLMAQAYAWIGERDIAVDWAEKQLERVTTHGYIFYWVVADTILRRKLDGFPRWDELQRRYGVAPDQVVHIEFAPSLR